MKTLNNIRKSILLVMTLMGLSFTTFICAGQGMQNVTYLQAAEKYFAEGSGTGAESNFSLKQEESLEIEEWMLDLAGENWVGEKAENEMELNSWMTDFKGVEWPVVDTVSAEDAVELESWMFNLDSWKL